MKYATRDGSPSSSMTTNGWPGSVVFSVARGRNVSPGVTVVLVLMYSSPCSASWFGPGPLANGARPLLLCGLRGLVRGQDDGRLVGLVLGEGPIMVGERGGPHLVCGAANHGVRRFVVSRSRCCATGDSRWRRNMRRMRHRAMTPMRRSS